MGIAVVIVGAGRGRRLGGDIPKQYIALGERTPLRRTIDTFLSEAMVQWLVPVIHPDDATLYHDAVSGVDDVRMLPAVEGSDTRARSVRKGLESLEKFSPDKVLIHDAARPFLTADVIHRVIDSLDSNDGACAALPIVDALWKSTNNTAGEQVSREGLWRAQTPQGFAFAKALAAHRAHDGSGADDVAVAKEFGCSVELVLGSENNYKITTSADLRRAISDAEHLDRIETVQFTETAFRVL